MTLWLVHVREERTAYFYVEADTQDAAQEDAEMLATEIGADWDDINQNVDLVVARDAPPPNTYIWSGGPDGEWRLA